MTGEEETLYITEIHIVSLGTGISYLVCNSILFLVWVSEGRLSREFTMHQWSGGGIKKIKVVT